MATQTFCKLRGSRGGAVNARSLRAENVIRAARNKLIDGENDYYEVRLTAGRGRACDLQVV
jgi:hypothetical protein